MLLLRGARPAGAGRSSGDAARVAAPHRHRVCDSHAAGTRARAHTRTQRCRGTDSLSLAPPSASRFPDTSVVVVCCAASIFCLVVVFCVRFRFQVQPLSSSHGAGGGKFANFCFVVVVSRLVSGAATRGEEATWSAQHRRAALAQREGPPGRVPAPECGASQRPRLVLTLGHTNERKCWETRSAPRGGHLHSDHRRASRSRKK